MIHRRTNRLRVRRSLETLESRRLLCADLNGDGQVGFADFLMLSAEFGQQVEFGTGADIDGDGMVGFGDFTILSNSFGASVVEFEPIQIMDPSNGERFETVVRSTEQWHALIRRIAPDSDPVEPPVNFDESMLVFAGLGERNLGQWAEVECVLADDTQIEVGFRYFLSGPAPPPGTHVVYLLVAVPAADVPVQFLELPTIAFP